MMECGECKRWVHAKCEQISDEKYQLLSYLPSSIEFVCRCCCESPAPYWLEAVNANLKCGLLSAIRALSKNKVICNLLKNSPIKKSCTCKNDLQKPIVLRNLSASMEAVTKTDSEHSVEDKSSDLGLLTPKMTKDDEACLENANTGLMNLVNNKVTLEEKPIPPTVYDFREDADDLPVTRFDQTRSLNLLSIVGWSNDKDFRIRPSKSPGSVDTDASERSCTCDLGSTSSPLTILAIKKKVEDNLYTSVADFNKDMTNTLEGIAHGSFKVYESSMKQIFPWFDPNKPEETSFTDETPPSPLDPKKCSKVNPSTLYGNSQTTQVDTFKCAWNDLLCHDPDYYYLISKHQDLRSCTFCKTPGEGNPAKEGRLLYCGLNEWVHVNCALWSSEVFEEIDGSLQNVHSAISRSRMIRCSSCKKKGASIGCCARSCSSVYHLACAMSSECTFLANNEMYCKTHSHMRGNKDIHNPDDFQVSRAIYVELDPKKKKEVLHSDVRLAIGSLLIHLIGEIIPEYSDFGDFIVPVNFKCSRLFWSCKEPWKLVRYFIETKIVFPERYCPESDVNYTIDHSLEITPPPSPVDGEEQLLNLESFSDKKDIKNLLNQLVDMVCAREEDNNLADQQATNLLPPDIEEAIFEDLPHDILDGISMHDIFTKMNFDDFTECRIEKYEIEDIPQGQQYSKKLNKEVKNVDSLKRMKQKSVNVGRYVGSDKDGYNKEADPYKWRVSNILQLDGAVDISSDSDQSMDSSDVSVQLKAQLVSSVSGDQPVKCNRCHRTYRSSVGFERHLPTCDSDVSSESDDENEQEPVSINHCSGTTCMPNKLSEELMKQHSNDVDESDSIQSSDVNSVDLQDGRIDVVLNVYEDNCGNNLANRVEIIESAPINDVADVHPSPAYLVHQIPAETVMPSYVPAYSQQPALQPSADHLQYFNTGGTAQFHYHSSPMASTVLPTIQPTVVGAIVQSNGVDQIVLNAPNHAMEIYQSPPTNNIYVTNPMIVGMETVVSNTVMSSSQFLPGVPGMLSSRYSATTTQVFHAAKPQIEIPQNYMVVAQPIPPTANHTASNISGMLHDSRQSNLPWNSHQMNTQESYKVENGNSSFQTVTRKIIHEHKNSDGVKTINSTQETIVIPMSHNNSVQQQYNCIGPITRNIPDLRESCEKSIVPISKPIQPKLVELPQSPTINREKPQQAVAPVLIQKVFPQIRMKEIKPRFNVERKYHLKAVESPPLKDNPVIDYPKENKDFSKDMKDFSKEKKNFLKESPHFLKGGNELTNNCSDHKESKDSCEDGHFQQVLKVPNNKTSPQSPQQKIEVVKSYDQSDNLEEPRKNKEIEIQKLKENENFVQKHETKRQPKIVYNIVSDDGFQFSSSDLQQAWGKVLEKVQSARKAKGLPSLVENRFLKPEYAVKVMDYAIKADQAVKKTAGLGNNGVRYVVEQLPGASSCLKYKPVYHKKTLSALEHELYRSLKENYSGCARTEGVIPRKRNHDMFSWLASRHRRPPRLTHFDVDIINEYGRRAASIKNIQKAMKFANLKKTSKMNLGVFRSDIHGRGLFCLRDIESGEMVIEYTGEVVRGSLTDKRERYYTAQGIGCYMFRIDDIAVIDATMKGNAARFINHSCDPNCYSKVVEISGKKHILIFALRKIIQGEELTYDYKFPLEEDKIKCHCLARRCRKYLN